MNNEVKTIFAFVLGAAAGAAITWKFVQKKYEAIAQEEIDSVKEVYAKKKEMLSNTTEDCIDEDLADIPSTEEQQEYKDIIEECSYDGEEDEEEGGLDSMNEGPYVIPPREFGEKDGYDTITLTYYSDGILTDDNQSAAFVLVPTIVL